MGSEWKKLLSQFEHVLELAQRWLEVETDTADASTDIRAYRWRGRLEAIPHPDLFPLDDLIGVDRSVARLRENLRAFVEGEPALDTLLYGERGTGKSSAVRGLLHEFGDRGLRLIEIKQEDLANLSKLYRSVRKLPEKFVLFCDDLSFEAGDASYKLLKGTLDGGLEARPENLLLIATSNRRYLMPEYMAENHEAKISSEGELHPGETAEEKLSLSDRFGLMLPLFTFSQDTYLQIVDHYADQLGLNSRLPQADLHERALRFGLERAGRSGRTARQACIAILQDLKREGR